MQKFKNRESNQPKSSGTRIKDIVPQPLKRHSNKIVVEKVDGDQSLITLKPAGFTASTAGIIFFALFWNGFLVVWTTMALMASFLFALFSIPFWLVGLAMIAGIVTNLFGYQEILIRRKNMVVRKFTVGFKIEHTIDYNTLNSIELEKFTKYSNRTKNSFKLAASGANDSGLNSKTVAISHSDKELFIGEHLNESDKEWLVEHLNNEIVPLLRYVS